MAPEILMLIIALLALTAYAVFGGADFGAGVWEVNTRLRADLREKDLLYRAIGPVWEANHVWLIFLLMILWSGFPVAFAGISRLLFIPLFLALFGIVFRGAAYAFRSSAKTVPRHRQFWEVVFAMASTSAPFFMGVAIGVLTDHHPEIDARGQFHGHWLTDWIRPRYLYFGFLATGICVFLAAVFLTRETAGEGDAELYSRWRKRALGAGLLAGIVAGGGLVVVYLGFPEFWQGLQQRGMPAVLVSIVCGLGTMVLVARHRPGLATVTAALAVAMVLAGWGLGHYPWLIRPQLTIDNAAAPDNVLWLLLGCILVGLIVVVPPLWWLLRIFKRANTTSAQRFDVLKQKPVPPQTDDAEEAPANGGHDFGSQPES